MSKQELIKNLLEIPAETQTVEFKLLTSKSIVEKVIQSIVAFANADGGSIVLGIDDPEKTKLKGLNRIYGIDDNLDLFDSIGREIQKIIPPLSNIWPPLIIKVEEINKRIALLSIPKSIDSFRSINNHVYVRQEKSNKLLSPQETIKFAYAKGFEKADKELVEVSFDLLNTEIYNEWKEKRQIKDSGIKIVLEKTGLARKDENGKILPTRAAVLLFAEYPTNLMETKCAIRVMQFIGSLEEYKETPNMIGNPETIQGPIIKQIKEAHNYVLTLLRAGIRMPLSGFETQYQIPERAVKEAITNAVIHRDYYTKRDIEIKIFEDRIEIENPGLFPYNITPANIGKVRSEGFRNDLIVKHLREFPSPPNFDQNEGVRAMRDEMKAQNLYPPIFWTYPNLQDAVRVVLLNEKVAGEWEKVEFYLQKNKYINNEKAREITGIIQRDRMTQMLKKWSNQGLLIQIKHPRGYLKDTKYRLPEKSELNK